MSSSSSRPRVVSVLLGVAIASLATTAGADFAAIGRVFDDSVEYLQGWSAATSPDGAFVYTSLSWGVSVYSLDPAKLAGSLVEVEPIGGGGTSITVAGDGGHVYVVGPSSSILIFERDPLTGELSAAGSVTPASSGVPELAGVRELYASPDGAHLYAVSRSGGAVVRFQRSPLDGSLAALGATTGFPSPITGLLAPDGGTFYVASDGDDSLRVLSRDPETGALQPLQTLVQGENGVAGLTAPAALSIPPDGRSLYVSLAPFSTATGGSFDRDPATGMLAFHETVDLGAPAPAGDRVVWMSTEWEGPRYGGSYVSAFARDPVTLDLTRIDTVHGAPSYPLLVSPDGDVALGGRTTRISRSTGFLQQLDAYAGAANGLGAGVTPFQVEVSADGRSVFALARNGLAVFARHRRTGRLRFVESESEGIVAGRQIAVSPDSRFVYVADGTNGILRFERDPATLALSLASPLGPAPPDGYGGVTLNGPQLYAAADDGSRVDVFARDAASGDLAAAGGVATSQIASFVPSPSEHALFATGRSGWNGWTRIERNGDGSLGAIDTKPDPWLWQGVAPLSDSLVFTASGACGGDGSGPCEGFVTLFDSGILVRRWYPAGVWSRYAPAAARLSPDGRILYVLGEVLVALDIDADSVERPYEPYFRDGIDERGTHLATSPDGAQVYVVNASPAALRVYAAPEPAAGAAAALLALLALRRARA